MELVEFDACGATIRLDKKELRMAMALIQEGRIAFDCDSPTGQALDGGFRTAAWLVSDAEEVGQELTSIQ